MAKIKWPPYYIGWPYNKRSRRQC